MARWSHIRGSDLPGMTDAGHALSQIALGDALEKERAGRSERNGGGNEWPTLCGADTEMD